MSVGICLHFRVCNLDVGYLKVGYNRDEYAYSKAYLVAHWPRSRWVLEMSLSLRDVGLRGFGGFQRYRWVSEISVGFRDIGGSQRYRWVSEISVGLRDIGGSQGCGVAVHQSFGGRSRDLVAQLSSLVEVDVV